MIKSVSDYALHKEPISRTLSRSNRYKTLPKNNFRGITKDVLQRQTSICIASMTVSRFIQMLSTFLLYFIVILKQLFLYF